MDRSMGQSETDCGSVAPTVRHCAEWSGSRRGLTREGGREPFGVARGARRGEGASRGQMTKRARSSIRAV